MAHNPQAERAAADALANTGDLTVSANLDLPTAVNGPATADSTEADAAGCRPSTGGQLRAGPRRRPTSGGWLQAASRSER